MCEILSDTGLAGAPTEVFNPDFMPALMQHWDVTTKEEYIDKLLTLKTGPNGVFGAKVGWGPYKTVFGDGDPRLVLRGLHMVFMTRRDQVRQAVSWVRAIQSRRWQSIHSGRQDHRAEFDAEHITRKLQRIRSTEESWRDLFDSYGITPQQITYEDLVADPLQTLRETLAVLGVEPPADLRIKPKIGRLADAVTEDWVARYRTETGER
jgi:LPS sulfotransferase NodH